MNLVKSITIKDPCSQSWSKMAPVNSGRYCEHCCKSVVNFASMTDDEIIHYLSTNQNVCGRFEIHQFNNLNRKLHTQQLSATNWWKRAVIVLGMMAPIAFSAKAANKPAVVQSAERTKTIRPAVDIMDEVAESADTAKAQIITGRICGQDDGQPIPGVTIRIKGTDKVTLTDVNGRFTLHSTKRGCKLVITYIGYEEKIIRTGKGAKESVELKINLVPSMLGGLGVIKSPAPSMLWFKAQSLFRKLC